MTKHTGSCDVKEENCYHVVIIGGGPAAVSAAIYCHRFDLKVMMIGEEYGGAISKTYLVENYPGFFETSGYDLMEAFQKHYEFFKVPFIYDTVTELKQEVINARKNHPNASLLVHPEAPPEVQHLADYIGSTSGMINYVNEHENNSGYIIGTEVGLMEHLIWKNLNNPLKKFFPLNTKSLCENMKKITLEKIYSTLKSIGTPEEAQYQVKVPPNIVQKALLSIDKMIDYS